MTYAQHVAQTEAIRDYDSEMEYREEQQRAELAAENAWLRYAEMPSYADMADEDRERRLALW
jgi:hypothetical protein